MKHFGEAHDLEACMPLRSADAANFAQYLASFEYWLKLQTNFNSQKQRPLLQITETAKTVPITEL